MRLRTVPLLVVIVAAVAALGAWTDRPHVTVEDAPPVVEATKPWDAVIEITRRGRPLVGYQAVLTIVGPRGSERIKAKDLGRGRYLVRVRLAHGGFYTYTLTVGRRVAARGTVYAIPR